MFPKVFIKVSILFVALALVYAGVRLFSSDEFKQSLTDMFATGAKTYSWCPEHAVDFQWLDTKISQRWKNASWPTIQKRFCRLTLEPIQNLDITKVEFLPLLKVTSAEAKNAQLEWNSSLNVFRVNGLPFYSPSLVREVVDK